MEYKLKQYTQNLLGCKLKQDLYFYIISITSHSFKFCINHSFEDLFELITVHLVFVSDIICTKYTKNNIIVWKSKHAVIVYKNAIIITFVFVKNYNINTYILYVYFVVHLKYFYSYGIRKVMWIWKLLIDTTLTYTIQSFDLLSKFYIFSIKLTLKLHFSTKHKSFVGVRTTLVTLAISAPCK